MAPPHTSPPAPAHLDDGLNGQVDVVCVAEADGDVGVPRKGGMHSPLAQDLAVDAVVCRGGDGPDHVGRVNVFDVGVALQQAKQKS